MNALSENMEVVVKRDGKVHRQTYERGKITSDLTVIGECESDDTGTQVTFLPDKDIFKETLIYDFDVLKNRLREMAFLTKGLKIGLTDERTRSEIEMQIKAEKSGKQDTEDISDVQEAEESSEQETPEETVENSEDKGREEVFHYEGGIKEFVSYLNKSKTPI